MSPGVGKVAQWLRALFPLALDLERPASQHSHGGLQLSTAPGPGDLTSLPDLHLH